MPAKLNVFTCQKVYRILYFCFEACIFICGKYKKVDKMVRVAAFHSYC